MSSSSNQPQNPTPRHVPVDLDNLIYWVPDEESRSRSRRRRSYDGNLSLPIYNSTSLINEQQPQSQTPTTPAPGPTTPRQRRNNVFYITPSTPIEQMLRPLRSSTPTPVRRRRREAGAGIIGADQEEGDNDISDISSVLSPEGSPIVVFSDDSDYDIPIPGVHFVPNRPMRRSLSPPNDVESLLAVRLSDLDDTPPRHIMEFEVADYDDVESVNPIENANSSSDADSSYIGTEKYDALLSAQLKETKTDDGNITDSEGSSGSDDDDTDASSSNSNGPRNGFSTDSEISEKDHWFCTQCNIETNKPYLRYCLKCFRIRREWLPKRPKPNRRRPVSPATEPDHEEQNSQDPNRAFIQSQSISQSSIGSQSQQSQNHIQSQVLSTEVEMEIGTGPEDLNVPEVELPGPNTSSQSVSVSVGPAEGESLIEPLQTSSASACASTSQLLKTKYPESNFLDNVLGAPPLKVAKLTAPTSTSGKSSSVGNESLCSICMIRERNAAFVHGKSAHLCTCYQCGDKILKKTGKCPICRKRILRVVKIVLV